MIHPTARWRRDGYDWIEVKAGLCSEEPTEDENGRSYVGISWPHIITIGTKTDTGYVKVLVNGKPVKL